MFGRAAVRHHVTRRTCDPASDPCPHPLRCCLRQLALILTMREGQSVTFQGSFYRYDDFKKMVWLENCKQMR